MGIAALYSRTIGQFANAVAAGRQEAKEGVRAAAALSAQAGAAPSRDVVSSGPTPHAPDSGVRANASLQAPKAPQGKSIGVNAAGSQRPNLRLAQQAPKADDEPEV